MDHIGIDVHKKESQICILGAGGELHHGDMETYGRPDAPVAAPGIRHASDRDPTGSAVESVRELHLCSDHARPL
jgi:hypothetical protein